MIKDTLREVGLMNELCNHLRGIGVRATLLQPGSSEAIGPGWKMGIFASGYVLGCVKIEGRNLDLVQVERNISNPPSGSQLSSRVPGHLEYQYHYVVRGSVSGLESKLKAELNPSETRKGSIQEATGLVWRKPGKISFPSLIFGLFFMALSTLAFWTATRQSLPVPLLLIFLVLFSTGSGLVFIPLIRRIGYKEGYLAQEMNNDSEVRNALVRSGLRGLSIKPDRKNQCVRITPMIGSATRISIGPASIDAVGRQAFPTREAFEAYDKIAQLIRNIESESPESSALA